MRPWMLCGEKLQSRNLVEDAGVVLWEGGTKSTPEIKREILEQLEKVDSLVAIVDLKAAEQPDEPRWWPSLNVVFTWLEEDPFFAKAVERWSHARQARILERVIYDLNSGKVENLTKADMELLKVRVKFASSVLPRMVNKGLREKVDIETTNNHLHLHQTLSDDALEEKLRQLRQNPRVLEFLTLPDAPGSQTVNGAVLPPAALPTLAPLPFRDPEAMGRALSDDGGLE